MDHGVSVIFYCTTTHPQSLVTSNNKDVILPHNSTVWALLSQEVLVLLVVSPGAELFEMTFSLPWLAPGLRPGTACVPWSLSTVAGPPYLIAYVSKAVSKRTDPS